MKDYGAMFSILYKEVPYTKKPLRMLSIIVPSKSQLKREQLKVHANTIPPQAPRIHSPAKAELPKGSGKKA